jgi:hypothetical protein
MVICLFAFLILSGCTGLKYTHQSSPEISDDAYDLIGPYQEVEIGQFEIEAGALWNAAPNHGWYLQGELKYRWQEK